MSDYIVTEAQVRIAVCGAACGPVSGPTITEACFTEDSGDSFYISLADIDGLPHFYKTPESTIERQASIIEDTAFWEWLNEDCFISGPGTFEDVLEEKDNEMYPIYRYLTFLNFSSRDAAVDFIMDTEGKRLSEIDIPDALCEIEWIEHYEED